MKNTITFFAGLIFGLGLIVSGMTDPANIIGFLDITGLWNPSLAFVMLGGIAIAFFAFRHVERKKLTAFNEPVHLPGTSQLNKELILGSLLFGSGWALAGFCPGPALVVLGTGSKQAGIFVLAMLVGMYGHDIFYKRLFNKTH
ncbi:MAG: YeeE/YedE family protein [Methylotenera sp.]|nr:YeeE/YedE family protein [Methylotenera sp.]